MPTDEIQPLGTHLSHPRGNGPNWAGPDLCSTRSGGKDDGSLHKLLQMIKQVTTLWEKDCGLIMDLQT